MSGSSVRLVVTDLDGTLWGRDERCHARTLVALDELEGAGIAVLVATGRRARSCRRGYDVNGLDLPAVLLNGALGLDAGFTEAFHVAGFDPAEAVATLAAYEDHAVSPCAYVVPDGDDTDVLLDEAPTTCEAHLSSLTPWARRGRLTELIGVHDVLGISVHGMDPERLSPVAQRIVDEACGAPVFTEDVLYGGWSLMVAPRGVSKVDGIAAWCDRHGIDASSVMAVGDGGNDVEMLEWAGVAVAPETATPAALDRADHHVGCPESGGFADLLDLL